MNIYEKASETAKVLVREGVSTSQLRLMLNAIKTSQVEKLKDYLKRQYGRGLLSPSALQYLLKLVDSVKTIEELKQVLSSATYLLDYEILAPLIKEWSEISSRIKGIKIENIRSVRVINRGSNYVTLSLSVDSRVHINPRDFALIYKKLLQKHLKKEFRVNVKVVRVA